MSPSRVPARSALTGALAAVGAALCGLVLAACISDEHRPADTTAATSDATSDTLDVVAPAACTAQGASECLSAATARVCDGGQWSTKACKDDESCTRASGRCEKGTLSCLGTLICTIDCDQGVEGCAKRCADDSTVTAVDALGDLNACQCEKDCWPLLCGRLFPWPSLAEVGACVADGCEVEGAACAGGGAVGKGGCEAVRDCVLACEGDVFCAEGCMVTGTAKAQTTAAFYYACMRQACGAVPEPVCLFDAQANACKDLWDTCRAEVATP